MVHAVTDPLPLPGESDDAVGIAMVAQRAFDRHQAITDPAILEIAASASGGRSDGVAAHTARQRRDTGYLGDTH